MLSGSLQARLRLRKPFSDAHIDETRHRQRARRPSRSPNEALLDALIRLGQHDMASLIASTTEGSDSFMPEACVGPAGCMALSQSCAVFPIVRLLQGLVVGPHEYALVARGLVERGIRQQTSKHRPDEVQGMGVLLHIMWVWAFCRENAKHAIGKAMQPCNGEIICRAHAEGTDASVSEDGHTVCGCSQRMSTIGWPPGATLDMRPTATP